MHSIGYQTQSLAYRKHVFYIWATFLALFLLTLASITIRPLYSCQIIIKKEVNLSSGRLPRSPFKYITEWCLNTVESKLWTLMDQWLPNVAGHLKIKPMLFKIFHWIIIDIHLKLGPCYFIKPLINSASGPPHLYSYYYSHTHY